MDKQVKIQIMVLLLGVLIGAGGYLANSLILYNNALIKEKTDIAEGLYLDVSSLEKPLVTADQDLQIPGENDDDFVFIQSNPLYPDNGLYYSYQRDIPKLNRTIAQDTFAFYNHLVSAERNRALIYEIQRQSDLRNLTPAEVRRQKILTQNVADEVNLTVSLLPPLKQELDTASNVRSQIPLVE
jgi:hypothetical protein